MGAAFLANFLRFLVIALWLLILGRVLMSWIDPTGKTRIGAFLVAVTEPILGPVRRLLPQTGMIDFSPLIVILVLGMFVRALT